MTETTLSGAKGRTRRTVSAELQRSVASGIIDTAATTFLLLIAVQWFQAGPSAKALLATSSNIGFLFTPWVLWGVVRLRVRAASAAAAFACCGGLSMLIGALSQDLSIFVVTSVIGIASIPLAVPLVTHMYHENYPANVRGKLFSRTVALRIVSGGAFSLLCGWWLSGDLARYSQLVGVYAAALFFSAFCFGRIPSEPLRESEAPPFTRALREAASDHVFRQTLISWMIFGFANLFLLPLRVEYLANPRYELGLTPQEIAVFVSVIPSAFRLIATPLFGWLFDRMNFFVMRIVANLCFVASALSFFATDSTIWLAVGAAIFGVATAGGEIAWALWVTKIAPAGKVAQYMSVHTCLTGVRGVIAPFAAFYLVESYSVQSISWCAVGLILISIVFLIPQARAMKRSQSFRSVALPETSSVG